MYGSALLCFGLTQAMLWHTWSENPDDRNQNLVRAWMWFMLLPDCHHLFVAYGPFLVGPHGRIDAAFAAHYAIQGLLTLARCIYLGAGLTARAGRKRS